MPVGRFHVAIHVRDLMACLRQQDRQIGDHGRLTRAPLAAGHGNAQRALSGVHRLLELLPTLLLPLLPLSQLPETPAAPPDKPVPPSGRRSPAPARSLVHGRGRRKRGRQGGRSRRSRCGRLVPAIPRPLSGSLSSPLVSAPPAATHSPSRDRGRSRSRIGIPGYVVSRAVSGCASAHLSHSSRTRSISAWHDVPPSATGEIPRSLLAFDGRSRAFSSLAPVSNPGCMDLRKKPGGCRPHVRRLSLSRF